MKIRRGGPPPELFRFLPFGERLAWLRKWYDLSQQGLARKARLSQRHVKALEADTAQPHDNTVRKLANALKVTVAELVE